MKHNKTIALTLIGAICLTGVSVFADSKAESMEYVRKAEKSFSTGSLSYGMQYLNKAIELDPNNDEAYRVRAAGEVVTGDKIRCQEDIDKALELNPMNEGALQGKNALTLFAHSELISISNLKEEVERNPKIKETYLVQAKQDIQNGSTAIGMENVNRLIEIDPNSEDAYLFRGTIESVAFQDYQRAEEDFDKAIELNPKSDKAYFQKAVLESMRGNISKALEYLDKAIKLNPNDKIYYGMEATTLDNANNLAGALQAWNKAIAIPSTKDDERSYCKNSGMIYSQRAKIKYSMKDLKGAADDYLKASEFYDKEANDEEMPENWREGSKKRAADTKAKAIKIQKEMSSSAQ